MTLHIPKVIFIVPYRNREKHKENFLSRIQYLFEDVPTNEYEIIFSHQQDTRAFNRGAMKNLGFIYSKLKYPNNYKDITFVFNDVDTTPREKDIIPFLSYQTERNKIKHFYGFEFALGGIVSITGWDFERINGFPCYWGWGCEDNALQKRAKKHGITIDRSLFYTMLDKKIEQLREGSGTEVSSRQVDNKVVYKFHDDTGFNGIKTITDIKYDVDNISISLNTICSFDGMEIKEKEEEERKIRIFQVNFRTWNIPEKEKSVVFETRSGISLRRLTQKKVSMLDVLGWRGGKK